MGKRKAGSSSYVFSLPLPKKARWSALTSRPRPSGHEFDAASKPSVRAAIYTKGDPNIMERSPSEDVEVAEAQKCLESLLEPVLEVEKVQIAHVQNIYKAGKTTGFAFRLFSNGVSKNLSLNPSRTTLQHRHEGDYEVTSDVEEERRRQFDRIVVSADQLYQSASNAPRDTWRDRVITLKDLEKSAKDVARTKGHQTRKSQRRRRFEAILKEQNGSAPRPRRSSSPPAPRSAVKPQ
ncbi:uncharacterized protein EV422DRAFT_519172 [Fimicolochytrium jonesii]|uniref:uncharacterized protein n=1 Tax=Fimicolochytrium jonesii TaxID=1396493 RepID=UPI0022FDCFAD|nr:uncharacterized protein EV422DRAFT_519172 [Fimicolochytrium jonesii]KAI8824174.1 hypothetical protein EV422DRAFT_519172 [Fimicolochytrium jonesii]